ncbi:MAG: phosphoribosylformylglycinamidine cyclo-ligase [Gammaproteobacteria bacterium]
MKNGKTYTYTDAGVSIDRGNRLVERIKPHVRSTERPGTLGNIGGFGGLFDIGSLGYSNPVLVSGTDGVGTKLKLAIEYNRHDTIGIDLVAMCVNDLLVQGAEPLFFLDYYACGSLDVDVAESVVKGIAEGCRIAGCALTGGETAEMPGMYQGADYDLAGFCVGIVEKENIIDGSTIVSGDVLIAMASSGFHSNGYSLIRKLLQDTETTIDSKLGDTGIIDLLMEPTRIYVKPVLEILKNIPVKGMAHITGGGLIENIPRVLPDTVMANIDCHTWQWPAIFQWLRDAGNIDDIEMYRTFNCGAGYVLIVAADEADNLIGGLNEQGEHAWLLGRIETRAADQPALVLSGV